MVECLTPFSCGRNVNFKIVENLFFCPRNSANRDGRSEVSSSSSAVRSGVRIGDCDRAMMHGCNDVARKDSVLMGGRPHQRELHGASHD